MFSTISSLLVLSSLGQVPAWANASTWETVYEAPGGQCVRARVNITGTNGQYRLYVAGSPLGTLENIKFVPNMQHQLGGPTDSIVGRWSLPLGGGRVEQGYFVFRVPQDGVTDGYWGYFDRGQLGPIQGSWDGILIHRPSTRERAPIQFEPPAPLNINPDAVPIGINNQKDLQQLPRGMETIIDQDKTIQANWLRKGAALIDAVGKLTLTKDVKVMVPDGFGGQNVSEGQAGQEVGTCFVIAKGFALSARHNFAYLSDQVAVEAIFPTKEVNRFQHLALDGPPILITPDVALLRLKSSNNTWPSAMIDLKAGLDDKGNFQALKYRDAIVIHYPNNQPETLSFRGSQFTKATDQTLRYTADTQKGSSGAPVFDLFWNLVAIHWGDPDDGERNMGYRVDVIVRRLREELPKHKDGDKILTQLGLQ